MIQYTLVTFILKVVPLFIFILPYQFQQNSVLKMGIFYDEGEK